MKFNVKTEDLINAGWRLPYGVLEKHVELEGTPIEESKCGFCVLGRAHINCPRGYADAEDAPAPAAEWESQVDDILLDACTAVCAATHTKEHHTALKLVMKDRMGTLIRSLIEKVKEEAYHNGRFDGLEEGRAQERRELLEKAQSLKILRPGDTMEDLVRATAHNKAINEMSALLSDTPAKEGCCGAHENLLVKNGRICCRWCCDLKHDHILCTDSSRCHCPCHRTNNGKNH
jgi:hypothetical protein